MKRIFILVTIAIDIVIAILMLGIATESSEISYSTDLYVYGFSIMFLLSGISIRLAGQESRRR